MAFEFLPTQLGKFTFRITTDSLEPIKLRSGPVVFSVSKAKPLAVLIENTRDKTPTPIEMENTAGGKTPEFRAELSPVQ
jgi:hypothetical protein